MIARALAYPWVYTTQLLIWLGVFASFFFVMSFAMATLVAQLDLGGKSLPAHWEAAYLDHGSYIRGYVISSQPVMFALSVSALVTLFYLQGFIRREVDRQIREGGDMRARADKIARAISIVAGFVLLMLAFKFLIFRTLPV